MNGRRVVMGLQFFPRGGSAQVTRYLAAALVEAGWQASLVAGSLGEPGEETHAETFFAGLDLFGLDYRPAAAAFDAGLDPFAAAVPMHPSYEDRAEVADAILSSVDPGLASGLAEAWTRPLADVGIAEADVVHLHHLTAQLDVVRRHWPDRPLVVHLHGTEIKFVEAVDARVAVAEAAGQSLATMAGAVDAGAVDLSTLDDAQRELVTETRWDQWRHGEHWRDHLGAQVHAADHVITVSGPDRDTAVARFGLDPERTTAITNAVDIDRFGPAALTVTERRNLFRHWLVDDAHGWDANGGPGTVSYAEADLDRLLGPDGTAMVWIYVGRFTEAKRVPLLMRAFAAARDRSPRPLSLLVWGGHPGEWEGEHPVDVARHVGDDGIFFAGWRGHHDLPVGLAACDALVMPSVNDSFAQTALEAMAVGLPVLATDSGGFPDMIDTGPPRPTGWLVAPDDGEALADALVSVANAPDEVHRRGANALAHARADLSWSGQVPVFEDVYDQAIAHHAARSR